ncbi:MAG TPA: DUF5996 family protein [Armatimonadota bacterium]|nr:DUF5996 family protein [Armatimonadota bacterium]
MKSTEPEASSKSVWPALPLDEWKDTCETLQLWTQIVGKIRLVTTPPINHSWNVTLYVTSRGLTTGPMPHDLRTFEIEFDFVDHRLAIQTSDGDVRSIPLRPISVADFYQELMEALRSMDLEVRINTKPNEIVEVIPFEDDHTHRSYDPVYANRFWQVLAQSNRVLTQFRSRFIGKCSPVHFFWGSFDLAVSRFSGRRAPEHPGGVPNLPDRVAREAYSHEVSSVGFWPGGGALLEPAFYSYAYPEPAGFKEAPIQPAGAYYHPTLHEFVLPYELVRQAQNPDEALLQFAQSAYDAAANLGKWDRAALERSPTA